MNSSKNILAIPFIAQSTPIFGLTDSDSEGTLKRPHEVRDGSEREVTAISNDWEASITACATNNIFSRERTLRRARTHTDLVSSYATGCEVKIAPVRAGSLVTLEASQCSSLMEVYLKATGRSDGSLAGACMPSSVLF